MCEFLNLIWFYMERLKQWSMYSNKNHQHKSNKIWLSGYFPTVSLTASLCCYRPHLAGTVFSNKIWKVMLQSLLCEEGIFSNQTFFWSHQISHESLAARRALSPLCRACFCLCFFHQDAQLLPFSRSLLLFSNISSIPLEDFELFILPFAAFERPVHHSSPSPSARAGFHWLSDVQDAGSMWVAALQEHERLIPMYLL